MPISLRPDRGDVPPIGDAVFDALLARALPPEEAVASLRPMVEGFAALYAAPVYGGAAAEASALAAFHALVTASRGPATACPGWGPATAGPGWGPATAGPARRPAVGAARRPAARRGRHGRRGLVSIRLGAAAAVALVAGSAAAAYSGGLPAPMQRVAHTVFGAPPATQGTPLPAPGRPATLPISGNLAYGLCQAYEQAIRNGHPLHDPVTLRRLAEAAGGASRVRAYCARVAHPGSPASGHPTHPQQGQPSDLPTRHGKATPAASHHGKPSTEPTPAATHHGKPTG